MDTNFHIRFYFFEIKRISYNDELALIISKLPEFISKMDWGIFQNLFENKIEAFDTAFIEKKSLLE